MKKNIPLSKWKTLFEYANRILEMEPWDFYTDYDITAIIEPGTGETAYGVELAAKYSG